MKMRHFCDTIEAFLLQLEVFATFQGIFATFASEFFLALENYSLVHVFSFIYFVHPCASNEPVTREKVLSLLWN